MAPVPAADGRRGTLLRGHSIATVVPERGRFRILRPMKELAGIEGGRRRPVGLTGWQTRRCDLRSWQGGEDYSAGDVCV